MDPPGRRLLNPTTWLLWTAACVIAALLVRNPWYLLWLSVVVLVVGWKLTGEAPGRSTALLALGIVATSTVINFLLSRSGETILFQLPVRILRGPYTLEGLLFGLSAGIQVATLLLIMGVFSRAVTAADLLRRTPRGLYPVGVAAAIGINFAPHARQTYVDLREASQLRPRSTQGWRGAAGILPPLVFEAVERATAQAEALASRGWATERAEVRRWPAALAWLALGASALVCAALPGRLELAVGLLVVALAARWIASRDEAAPARVRVDRWSRVDTFVVGLSLGAAVALFLTAGLVPGSLGYYPYPVADLPPLAIGPLAAVTCLLAPAGAGRT